MNIALDARFVIQDHLEGFGNFTFEIFNVLIIQYPEHQFYFILDRPTANLFPDKSNAHQISLTPAARHPLIWKWWYDFKIPRLLKKIKADVFVGTNGFSSLRTHVPQVLIIHDLGFLHYPQFYNSSHARFYKKHTPLYVKKATAIATVSNFSAQDIIEQYKVNAGKITVVYNGIKDIFQPISQRAKSETKEHFTQGKEFFLYAGAIHPRKNLINLLKAFSIFKKRLKSNMKLVLAGRLAWKNEGFMQLLKTYKYKDDVIITGYVPDEVLVNLMGLAMVSYTPRCLKGLEFQ